MQNSVKCWYLTPFKHLPTVLPVAAKYVPRFDTQTMDSSLRFLHRLGLRSYPRPSRLVDSDCRRGLAGRTRHCGFHFLSSSPDCLRIFESFHSPSLISDLLKPPKHSPGPVHALLDLVALHPASSNHEEDLGADWWRTFFGSEERVNADLSVPTASAPRNRSEYQDARAGEEM